MATPAGRGHSVGIRSAARLAAAFRPAVVRPAVVPGLPAAALRAAAAVFALATLAALVADVFGVAVARSGVRRPGRAAPPGGGLVAGTAPGRVPAAALLRQTWPPSTRSAPPWPRPARSRSPWPRSAARRLAADRAASSSLAAVFLAAFLAAVLGRRLLGLDGRPVAASWPAWPRLPPTGRPPSSRYAPRTRAVPAALARCRAALLAGGRRLSRRLLRRAPPWSPPTWPPSSRQ